MKEESKSMETRIQEAMRPRVQHFRDQADSLSFEGVRRLLEKDLVLDAYALDAHKKYVKQLLQKYLSGTEDDENVSKGSEQNKLEKVKEKEERPKEHKVTDDGAKVEDSPVMGLLSAKESANSETQGDAPAKESANSETQGDAPAKESANSETQGDANEKIPTEDMIKEALWNKATYFRSKSEELTVAGVRRLLEEDLELKKFSLDSFKKLISMQLDEVLNSQSETPNDTDLSHSESDVEVKPKKKLARKGKVQKSHVPKKRKRPADETVQAKKKKIKNAEGTSVEKNNVQDVDHESSKEKSESSAGKSVKKEAVVPVYGKKVERLKSIIKACGMSVAPTVYKKAKQAPEDKREAFLIKELKEILSKEGLSTNPSEKEIKEVKRRKEKAKELEGIDTSNIVVGSRRRSTFNFVAPPKSKEPIESDGDDSQDSENENDDEDGSEDTDNEDDNDNEDAADDQDNVHATQSEEVHQEEDTGNEDDNDNEDAADDQDNVHATQIEEVHQETVDIK